MFLTSDPAWSQINREKEMNAKTQTRVMQVLTLLVACAVIFLAVTIGMDMAKEWGKESQTETTTRKVLHLDDSHNANFVPQPAGTEMAPESAWNPAVPPPPTQETEIGVLLDVSVTTGNGTRQYSVVEDASVPWNEGTLTVGPRETGSGSLGLGLVQRSGDRKFFLCVMDMSAREKSTRGKIRLLYQSEDGNPNIICLFTPN